MDKEYKTSKEEFDAWLETCPVDYDFTNELENNSETTEFYLFRIP